VASVILGCQHRHCGLSLVIRLTHQLMLWETLYHIQDIKCAINKGTK